MSDRLKDDPDFLIGTHEKRIKELEASIKHLESVAKLNKTLDIPRIESRLEDLKSVLKEVIPIAVVGIFPTNRTRAEVNNRLMDQLEAKQSEDLENFNNKLFMQITGKPAEEVELRCECCGSNKDDSMHIHCRLCYKEIIDHMMMAIKSKLLDEFIEELDYRKLVRPVNSERLLEILENRRKEWQKRREGLDG